MTSLLALAVVGSWTYAGFLAEPTPPPAPNPPAVVVPTPPVEPEGAKPRVEEPRPESPRPSPQALHVPPAVPPVRYRLADARGQHWEHEDPAYLRNFVYARNVSFVTPTVSPSPPGCASRPGGLCP